MPEHHSLIAEVIDPVLVDDITVATVLGVDIGSRSSKAVLISGHRLFTALTPTGIDPQETAEELLEEIFKKTGATLDDVDFAVCTGYGRVSLHFGATPTEILTEISCHAMGAHYLNAGTRTIIDIGGQDAKAIQVDPKTGKVVKFKMNDKCAAGTGRFLEKAANLLEYTIHQIGPASLAAEYIPDVSSRCVVFAESEVVSLRAKGQKREEIAAGVHYASARRVIKLLNSIPLDSDLVFTGGVSNNLGMKRALETLLGQTIVRTRLDMVYAGALGAAIYAQRFAAEKREVLRKEHTSGKGDLSDLLSRNNDAELSLISRSDVKKIGYLCSYTPIELLNAAGVAHIRLAKCGSPDVVGQGEVLTKAIFCDVTKSVLGHFATKDPLYDNLDHVATFYTCDSMRATADAIDAYFKPVHGYVVPRGREKETSRQMFRQQILHFKSDLETIAGRTIDDDEARRQILLYNELKSLIKKISDLRKRNNPPLSGIDFLEVTRAYRTLPPAEALAHLQDIYERLSAIPDDNTPRLRFMLTGGMMADGDRRLMSVLENDLHANIVVEDHCTGLSPFYYSTKISDDPWRDLADAYLDKAPCARQTPLTDRIDFAAMLAREYRVDGVIYTYLKFCPCYGITNKLFLNKFRELGIPVLDLDNDYSQNDTGQIKTRVEAFVEVLKENNRAVAS